MSGMEKFDYQDVAAAYERIKDYIYKTPLEHSMYLSDGKTDYFYKLESTQTVKSFKIRGALSKMRTLTEEERSKGVATISSGNHGASVSYAASLLGIENAVVIVPETTPQSKVDKIEYYGAQALRMGANYDEAHRLGDAYIKERGMTYVDPYYDDTKVYAGQGTVAIEILEQDPDIDVIVVPIGGGGLITGIAVAAKAIKPSIRVIGVQTEACPAMVKSYEDGVFYEEYPNEPSLCDALIGGVGALSYAMAKDYVDEFLTVSEENIAKATAFMIQKEKFVVEPSSATCVAAVWQHKEQIGGTKAALVMSGGNLDSELMVELLNQYR